MRDALGLGGRPDGFERFANHRRDMSTVCDAESNLAGDDARHVEHVLDDLRQRLGVARDGLDARAPASSPASSPERIMRA